MIFVAIGGFCGAITRYLVSGWVNNWTRSALPWGTFSINIIGSFLLGVCFQFHALESLFLLYATGFLGAFTTFSTFTYEFVKLWYQKKKSFALTYAFLSFALSLVAAICGFQLNFSLFN